MLLICPIGGESFYSGFSIEIVNDVDSVEIDAELDFV